MDKFNRVVKVPDEERLRNMTTLCLSVLCARAGGLKNVSEQLRIQYELLMRLQDLCDGNGDGRLEGFSREALEADSGPMISGEQRQWANAALRAVVTRTGEWAHNPAARLEEITMEDCRTS
jgi:hypothetical protein